MSSYSLWTQKSWSETEADIAETFRKWGVAKKEYEILSDTKGVAARSVHTGSNEVVVRFRHPKTGTDVPVRHNAQSRAVDNLRVCYLALEALRLNEARGISETMREAYLALPAPETVRDPSEVLSVRPDSPWEVIEATYRALARSRHPDNGGSNAAMKELNDAYARLKAERQGGR